MAVVPNDIYIRNWAPYAYGVALLSVFTGAAGFLSALLIRDLIFGLFKKYDVWDTEKGFETRRDILIASGITGIVLVVTAGLVLFTARRCG